MKPHAIALLCLTLFASPATADDIDVAQGIVDARIATLPAAEAQALLPVRNDMDTLRQESINFGTASHGFSAAPDCVGETDLPALFDAARRMAAVSALLTDTQAEWLALDAEQRDLLAGAQASVAADVMLSPHAWLAEAFASRFRTPPAPNALIEWSTPAMQEWATQPPQSCMTLDAVMRLLLEASLSHRLVGWDALDAVSRRQLVKALTSGLYVIAE